MLGNFAPSLAFTLAQEGLWSDSPEDPGRCTMRGITLGAYRAWCAWTGLPEPGPNDLRNINDKTLAAIYRDGYWALVNGDGLPEGIDLVLFDASVNTGPSTAAMQLQRILGVTADGDVGPITLAAAAKASPFVLIANLADAQEAYYRTLAGFATFGAGWIARVQRRRSAGMAMASGRGS